MLAPQDIIFNYELARGVLLSFKLTKGKNMKLIKISLILVPAWLYLASKANAVEYVYFTKSGKQISAIEALPEAFKTGSVLKCSEVGPSINANGSSISLKAVKSPVIFNPKTIR